MNDVKTAVELGRLVWDRCAACRREILGSERFWTVNLHEESYDGTITVHEARTLLSYCGDCAMGVNFGDFRPAPRPQVEKPAELRMKTASERHLRIEFDPRYCGLRVVRFFDAKAQEVGTPTVLDPLIERIEQHLRARGREAFDFDDPLGRDLALDGKEAHRFLNWLRHQAGRYRSDEPQPQERSESDAQ